MPGATQNVNLHVHLLQVKFVLIGDGTVGKTMLAQRVASNAFDGDYKQTLGVDCYVRRMTFPSTTVTVQLSD